MSGSRRPTILLDRCLPPTLAAAINHFDIATLTLEDVYPGRSQLVQDIEWIECCGREGWLGLTQNFRIRTVSHEVAAIRRSGAKVICFAGRNLPRETKAMILGRHLLTVLRYPQLEGPGFWRLYHNTIKRGI